MRFCSLDWLHVRAYMDESSVRRRRRRKRRQHFLCVTLATVQRVLYNGRHIRPQQQQKKKRKLPRLPAASVSALECAPVLPHLQGISPPLHNSWLAPLAAPRAPTSFSSAFDLKSSPSKTVLVLLFALTKSAVNTPKKTPAANRDVHPATQFFTLPLVYATTGMQS